MVLSPFNPWNQFINLYCHSGYAAIETPKSEALTGDSSMKVPLYAGITLQSTSEED